MKSTLIVSVVLFGLIAIPAAAQKRLFVIEPAESGSGLRDIASLALDGTDRQTIVADTDVINFGSLAVASNVGRVYWYSFDGGVPAYNSVRFDGSDLQVTPVTDVGLCMDAQGDTAMLPDGTIVYDAGFACSLDGSGAFQYGDPATNPDVSGRPAGVELIPSLGKLFSITNFCEVTSMNLDGSDFVELADLFSETADCGGFNALAHDPVGQKLYFTGSAELGSVEGFVRTDLDGSNPVEFLPGNLAASIAVDGDNGKLYWTSFFNGTLNSANLDGTDATIMGFNVQSVVLVDLSGGGDPVPAPPIETGEAARTNRYLRFSAPFSGFAEEVIRVTVVSLDGFPNPMPNVLYLGPPQSAPDETSTSPGLTFVTSRLQCEPYAHNWASDGVISAYGGEIIPGSLYEVQRASSGCPNLAEDEACWSAPLTLSTAKYGDIWPLFDSPDNPAQPDFSDISAMVQKFLAAGEATAPIKAVAQLQPNCVFPSRPIDFNDISAEVNAFLGTPYSAVQSGPCACPSNVQCGQTACASDATCGTGLCVNGFCADACGRCTQ
jgi:hypothetical protein